MNSSPKKRRLVHVYCYYGREEIDLPSFEEMPGALFYGTSLIDIFSGDDPLISLSGRSTKGVTLYHSLESVLNHELVFVCFLNVSKIMISEEIPMYNVKGVQAVRLEHLTYVYNATNVLKEYVVETALDSEDTEPIRKRRVVSIVDCKKYGTLFLKDDAVVDQLLKTMDSLKNKWFIDLNLPAFFKIINSKRVVSFSDEEYKDACVAVKELTGHKCRKKTDSVLKAAVLIIDSENHFCRTTDDALEHRSFENVSIDLRYLIYSE